MTAAPTTDPAPLVGIDDRPPPLRAVVWGFQHVLAMFAGMVAVPLAVGAAIGLDEAQLSVLIQGAMLTSGIATLAQSLGLGPIGARLPIVMGTAFVFISPMIGTGQRWGVPAIMGALIVGGLAEAVVAVVAWRVRRLFPALVTGTVIILIGLGLVPLAFFWAAGGDVALGEPRSFLVSGVVLVALLALSQWGGRFIASIAIVVAIAIGYGVAALVGLVDFSPLAESPWVAAPEVFAFGLPEFHFGAILAVLVAQFASMLETIGNTMAVGGVTGKPIRERELRGALTVDGLGSALAPVFNGFSVTSFAQNLGVISITRCASRIVVAVGGALLIFLALFPKVATVISVMPAPVLGGAALAMFGAIAAAGVNTLRQVDFGPREILIFAVSVALGLGVATRPEGTFSAFPENLRVVLESSVAVGGLMAVVLNQVLPRRHEKEPT